MKIESVRIQNFRAFADETVFLDDYTCLVGPNGSGKSTILTALNIFFRDTVNASTDLVNLGKEDFHQRDTSQPIRITVTFCDLSPDAQEDLKDYFRQNKLIVSSVATWNEQAGCAAVEQHGERLGIEAFRAFFDKEKQGGVVKDLQHIYTELRKTFPDLADAKTKGAMEDALHNYESAHPAECALLPSPDQFYGFSKGTNRLQKHVQWVYVPAVKDATTEQVEAKSTALKRLLARRVHSQLKVDESIDQIRRQAIKQYQELLDSNAYALKGLRSPIGKGISRGVLEPEDQVAHLASALQESAQKPFEFMLIVVIPLRRNLLGNGPQ